MTKRVLLFSIFTWWNFVAFGQYELSISSFSIERNTISLISQTQLKVETNFNPIDGDYLDSFQYTLLAPLPDIDLYKRTNNSWSKILQNGQWLERDIREGNISVSTLNENVNPGDSFEFSLKVDYIGDDVVTIDPSTGRLTVTIGAVSPTYHTVHPTGRSLRSQNSAV
ncbi:hypothetical protein [Persicobacter diffluens]|uniref:Uncharacterized protein n=1 Tax=Persicobacter diffluens TaxID=981 RepID=A0AAN4W1M7_9BACT|nr:hypothetical protein PEDI_45780 [Persicobacter diffluens]